MFNFPVTVMHYMVEDDQGIDFHSRFWFGLKYDGEKLVRTGSRPPEIALKKMVKHCLEEFTSLSDILPKLYNETEGKLL